MERGSFLLPVQASTVVLLLLTLFCDSPSLAHNSLLGVQAGQEDSPWEQDHNNQGSASPLVREASPLHSLAPGEKRATKDGERLIVSFFSEDGMHHTFYNERDPRVDDDNDGTDDRLEKRGQTRHKRPGNSASRLLVRSSAKKYEESRLDRGNPRGRAHTMSSSANSFLSRQEDLRRPGRLKFAAAAAVSSVAAATVAFFLLGEKLGGSKETQNHTFLGEEKELEMPAFERRMKNHGGDGMNAAAVSGGKITAKTLGSNKLLGLQLAFVVLLLYILVCVFPSTSAHPLPRGGTGSKDGGENPEQPAAPGETANGREDGGWLLSVSGGEDIPAGQFSRRRLVRKRLISGLCPGVSPLPPVDYQQRSDGRLLITVGRAWRLNPYGPWIDGDSCIKFNYGGHRFHVYLPKHGERLLKDLGSLEEVLEVLSRFPPRVALNPDEDSRTELRVLRWGPETYPGIYLVDWAALGLAYKVHLPPAVHSLLSRYQAGPESMRRVLVVVGNVLARMLEEGPDGFRPALLKMTEEKSEL